MERSSPTQGNPGTVAVAGPRKHSQNQGDVSERPKVKCSLWILRAESLFFDARETALELAIHEWWSPWFDVLSCLRDIILPQQGFLAQGFETRKLLGFRWRQNAKASGLRPCQVLQRSLRANDWIRQHQVVPRPWTCAQFGIIQSANRYLCSGMHYCGTLPGQTTVSRSHWARLIWLNLFGPWHPNVIRVARMPKTCAEKWKIAYTYWWQLAAINPK